MGIQLTLGQSEHGFPVRLPLAKAPHLLVAGMTGSGKSVFVHRLITDLITNYSSREIAFVMIDPKRVELAPYKGIPHLVQPPVYSFEDSRSALKWAEREMEGRYREMEEADCRDLETWNRSHPVRSRVLIVIDELANLILTDKSIEKPIVRIASMGRAAGIHLLLATQRPSADVLTGLIRANVPTRICLSVLTKMDSRIVLDQDGAEKLMEPGMILARLPGERELVRLQGAFISDEEIQQTVAREKAHQKR